LFLAISSSFVFSIYESEVVNSKFSSKKNSVNSSIISGNFSIYLPEPTTTQLTGSIFPYAITPWTSSNQAAATLSNTSLIKGVSIETVVIGYTNLGGCSTLK